MNDQEIGEMFRTEDDPPPRAGYWEEIHARLSAVDAERARSHLTVVAPEPNRPLVAPPSVTVEKVPPRTDTNVTVLRQSTMNINNYPRSTQRSVFLVAAAAVVIGMLSLGLLLQSSGDDGSTDVASEGSAVPTVVGTQDPDGSSDATTSSTTPTTEDTTSDSTDGTMQPTPTTTPDVDGSGDGETDETGETGETGELVNQAEPELQFDYGNIVRFEEIDGQTWIWFDRWAFTEQQIQGVEHTREPRYELATDYHGGLNTSDVIRSYPLAADATVLLIDPEVWKTSCAHMETDAPTHIVSDLTTLQAHANFGKPLVALTFNDDNEVSLIRDQKGC